MDLCPPKWSDPFSEVLFLKKAESCVQLFQMALMPVFNQEEDNSYSMAGKFDPHCTYLSLYCVHESLLKLVVNCKFSTQLVASIDKSSPTVDIYSFVPQLVNSTEVTKATAESEYERNKSIMGQNKAYFTEKKLSAIKLGTIKVVKEYDDVICNIMNLTMLHLNMGNLTSETEN